MIRYARRKRERRPVNVKSAADLQHLRQANRLVALTFAHIEPLVRPGARLVELDQAASAFIADHGAQPLYKGYRGSPPTQPPFPGVICASVNEEICHGIPDERALRDGDIVGIDIGLQLAGWCGDACVTYAVGTVAPAVERLLTVARQCRDQGIAAARPGVRLSNIGAAIEAHATAHGYSVVREWGGHGIGRELHEGLSVPHVGPAGRGPLLRPGMVFTVEPMINAGSHEWVLMPDGWTVRTLDLALSAQFEHTIAITDDGAEILSRP